MAFEYNKIGEVQKSIDLYHKIIAKNADYSWAYYNLASIYSEKGDTDRAIFYLERTLKTNPNDMQAVKLVIKLFFKQKKYEAAERLLKQLIPKAPEQADIYYLLAQVYNSINNPANYYKFLKFAEAKLITFSGDKEMLKNEIADFESKQKK